MPEGDLDNGTEGGDDQNTTNWYDSLENADLKNNPTLQKYDSAEAAHKGHLELAKSFGKDKVTWPTDENDATGWADINKRLGVPESAEGYDLKAVGNPEGVDLLNRVKFQEDMLAAGASKKVANAAWDNYSNQMKIGYSDAQAKFKAGVESASNELRQEWGEAYDSKVQMGQSVIDMLGDTQEDKDFLTVALTQNTAGIKLLAKVGEQYIEHSIGGFQEKQNFTLTPKEAREELDTIRSNSDYLSDNIKVRQPLIDRSNDLMKMIRASK